MTTTPPTTNEMKPWQHGIELDRLKAIATTYDHHNSFALSPFAQFKKNNIAEAIHAKEFVELDGASYCIKHAKRDQKIVMFQDVAIGMKQAGDVTLSHLSWRDEAGRALLYHEIENLSLRHNLWLTIFEEDEASRELAWGSFFEKIGTKFTSFAEIIGVYFKPSLRIDQDALWTDDPIGWRMKTVPATELLTCAQLRRPAITDYAVDTIANVVAGMEFTNHYSNYNKSKSWSALALRGYSSDPACIIKPAEMPDKWKQENADKSWQLQWTPLIAAFPLVRTLCESFCFDESEIQRVRLMKLAPAGGELQRHTDQVDEETGTRAGQFLRIHVPIVTNDLVLFTTWGVDAVPVITNMKAGELWYLDTRKPHRAVNGGTTDRIHLVVDVKSNNRLLSQLPVQNGKTLMQLHEEGKL